MNNKFNLENFSKNIRNKFSENVSNTNQTINTNIASYNNTNSEDFSFEFDNLFNNNILEQNLNINGNLIPHVWCNDFEGGTEIGDNLNWSTGNLDLELWSEINGTTFGNWYLIEGISYIGFKFKTKYGWL